MNSFTFATTKSIINESGALQRIGEICRSQHISRPLIVTDPGIVSIGLLDKLEAALKASDMPYHSFTDIVADPPESIVLTGPYQNWY